MVGPINPFAGLAGVQTGGNRNQIQDERENKQVQTEIETKAGADAQATESSETSDRDADGRQLLLRRFEEPEEEATEETSQEPESQSGQKKSISMDPLRGGRLDLTG